MKYSLTFLISILINTWVNGQDLKGSIKDQMDQPIPNANVLNVTTGSHAHSNDNGSFVLENTKAGHIISISHVAYKSKTFEISSMDAINIKLERSSISLDEITIKPQVDALNLITDIDIKTNPVNSSQEILRQVPGLFISQHAGGGKAEQIFLRGFDIDHGTDIAITVDGLPVNMVSHAHGQGYSDLHFVIPEAVENMDFGKGPYDSDKGNFATAGYVNFRTKDKLQNSILKLELGQFNTQRLVGLVNILKKDHHNAFVGFESSFTDGPFESPQNFNRINLMAKYNGDIDESNKISLLTSYFTSEWDASGQIPERAVASDMIGRFGAIDDTEGGKTGRTNFLLKHKKLIDNKKYILSDFFYNQYDFELYSNFTFFQRDSINGDQIKQKESRNIIGLNSSYQQAFGSNALDGNFELGVFLRQDFVRDNELSYTIQRDFLSAVRLGDIRETNSGLFSELTFSFRKLTFISGLRLDYFNFSYSDHLSTLYSNQSERAVIISPKFKMLLNQSKSLQYYLKLGSGFHSNDSRLVIAQNVDKVPPRAHGGDLGFIWKPGKDILVNVALWYLFLEQEFVYVGDEGIIEPSGRTQREGVDLSLRYQPTKWLICNLDANYTSSVALDEDKESNHIPLAPNVTATGSISVINSNGLHGGLNVRFMNDRPANEDNSIVAKGYTVFDFNAGYQWKKLDFQLRVQNLLDTDWNETQFATLSRLRNESTSIEEIHFTPGNPFTIRGSITYKF
ncbi:MAG: TonB-dependent receptor [Flavobacteriales bacterium]|nr:TonB-dependent receptor [Flavobacteriales bacterium]